MDSTASSLQDTLPLVNPADVAQLQVLMAHQGEQLSAYQAQLAALQNTKAHLLQVRAF